MSYFFKTFEEIGEYVDAIKGYRYVDNPSSWLEALKQTIGDAKYIGIEGQSEGTFYNPKGWNWVEVGKSVETSGLTGGQTSVPTTSTVVTDLSTGGATAGATALATEATGITIELSLAGYIATALTGLGLGVVSYELAPHFWTDLSNAMFGDILGEVSYEESEPLLRKKIKGFISKSKNGKLTTYLPYEPTEKAYNFFRDHIVSHPYVNTNFPGAIFDSSGNCIAGQTQSYTKPYFTKTFLDYFMDKCVDEAHAHGYLNCKPINTDLLYNQMQSNFDMSRVNLFSYQFSVNFNYWNADFHHSGTPSTSVLGINCYSVSKETIRLLRRSKNYEDDYYYIVGNELIPQEQQVKPIYSCSMYWKSNNYEPSINLRENDTATYMAYDNDLIVGIGSDKTFDPTDTYKRFVCTNINAGDTVPVLDDYLTNAGVKAVGKIPNPNSNFQQYYKDWYGNAKDVAGVDKDENDNVNVFIPMNTPMGDTDKIINKGVNIDDDSYNDSQDKTQQGEDLPSIDDINDSIGDIIPDYDDSPYTPDNLPEPKPGIPIPTYPTYPNVPNNPTPDSPKPPSIIGGTATGMISIYNPTKEELSRFSSYLWSNNFLDNFLKIFQNPMDAVIGLHILYATPITGGKNNIIVGYLDSGVPSDIVTKQYTEIDCGTVNVSELYGNATDYEPYTKVACYLPFVGIVPLKTDDVMGKKVNIKYGVDVLTGTCLATITVTNLKGVTIAMYTFTGNCAVQLPLSGGNYSGVIRGLVGMVGSVAVGGAIGAIGAVGSALNSKLDVAHSGSIGSNAGAMGVRKPYLIITRTEPNDALNYNRYYGFPSNKAVSLKSCLGYTKVKEVHAESIDNATITEKNEIENLLKSGVIISSLDA